ncbi:hypothetical protein SEA_REDWATTLEHOG_143 [Gordonia phage RedWattleHog]|nr:hypothetical protein SEA_REDWATTLEHOG_143 [Gordonia phage RedWattleHog]
MQHESDGIDWSGPVENMERFAEYMRNQPPPPRQEERSDPDGEHHVHFAFDAARPGWTTPIYDVHGNKVSDPVPIDSLPRHGDERP